MEHVEWLGTNTVERFAREVRDKRVVVWGAGAEARRVLGHELADIDLAVAYFVDGNSEKQGKPYMEREVRPPGVLRDEDSTRLVVLICCRDFLLADIVKQLKACGVTRYFAAILFDDERREQYIARFSGEYHFDDRRKGSRKMLIVLTGYKEVLWDIVFKRIARFVPADIDVCLVLSGRDNEEMKSLARRQGWSYLSTRDNRLSLAQNIAIQLHTQAELIFKLDEDMFIGEHFFTDMEQSFLRLRQEAPYQVGFLAPMIPTNVVSYVPFIEKMGLAEDYKKRFTEEINARGAWALHYSGDVNYYLWDHSLPFDEVAQAVRMQHTGYAISPYRFSIGAILFRRELWEQMMGFEVGEDGETGSDENHLCISCMQLMLAVYVDTNILVGHLAYGEQTDRMLSYYQRHHDLFDCADEGGAADGKQ